MIIDKGVCTTAMATLGLLIPELYFKKKDVKSF